MKRYKDIRFIGVVSILLIGLIIATVYSITQGSRNKLIIGLIGIAVCLMMMMSGYNVRLYDSYLITYDNMILFLYPRVIDYKDITEFKVLNKHVISINQKHKMYVFDAYKVEKDYLELNK